MYMETAGVLIKEGMFSGLELATLAAASPTPEAREITKRWKAIFARYSNLSKRYWNLTKQLQSLRLEPAQVEGRYQALDEAFDEVCEEISAVYVDLEKWATSGVG